MAGGWQSRTAYFSLKRGSLLTIHKEQQVQHSIKKLLRHVLTIVILCYSFCDMETNLELLE